MRQFADCEASGDSTASGGREATTAGSAPTGGSSTGMTGDVPCDVLNNAGQLCVSAHSTVRQFVSSYLGNLYQLRRSGIRPQKPGYLPMQKQGSVILGISGDNSAQAGGRFYEGVIANGAATAETLEAVQASIVAAGYGQ